MSDKKTRETDKIKFFEVGTEGEIRPAFPDPNAAETQANEVRADYEPVQSLILKQLDQMKPQLENLTSGNKGLTSEEATVLNKYVSVREAEVEDLRVSLKQYQEHFQKTAAEIASLTEKNIELARQCESRKGSQEHLTRDLVRIKEDLAEKIASLTAEYEERLSAQGGLQRDLVDLERKKNEWKSAVSEDLRRIKLKEREIETKHEMLKRDSQVLLDSKDKQILELRRKCDALELEMETLEERVRTQSMQLANVEARKKRLLETLRLAMSLIEGIERPQVTP